MRVTKEKLFNLALAISDLEQKQDKDEKERLNNLKKDYESLMNYFKEYPGPAMFDEYLLFTANREAYSLEECLLIEKDLLKELRPKFADLIKAGLN